MDVSAKGRMHEEFTEKLIPAIEIYARKNKRIGVDPQNLQWRDNESSFGKKMMKSMGWQEGIGLGLEGNGMTDNIKMIKKMDNFGLGYSPVCNDASRVGHQDEFDDLLRSLCPVSDSLVSVGVDNSATLEKLGEKASYSKGRLNYSKFSRGKDLSAASEQDLQCIFGKKTEISPSQNTIESDGKSVQSDNPKHLDNSKSIFFNSNLTIERYLASKKMTTKLPNTRTDSKDNLNDKDCTFQSGCNKDSNNLVIKHKDYANEDLVISELGTSTGRGKLIKNKPKKCKMRNSDISKSPDNFSKNEVCRKKVKDKNMKLAGKEVKNEENYISVTLEESQNTEKSTMSDDGNKSESVQRAKRKKSKKEFKDKKMKLKKFTMTEESFSLSNESVDLVKKEEGNNRKRKRNKRKSDIEDIGNAEFVETKLKENCDMQLNKKKLKKKIIKSSSQENNIPSENGKSMGPLDISTKCEELFVQTQLTKAEKKNKRKVLKKKKSKERKCNPVNMASWFPGSNFAMITGYNK